MCVAMSNKSIMRIMLCLISSILLKFVSYVEIFYWKFEINFKNFILIILKQFDETWFNRV